MDKKQISVGDKHGLSEGAELLKKRKPSRSGHTYTEGRILLPKDIYAFLDKHVLGQEAAKKSLSVVLYQHLMRYEMRKKKGQLSKTNALLVGPTGCGKTLTAKTLADIASLPFVKLDATGMVERGYRGGNHVEQIIQFLLSAAKGNWRLAEYGVIFIDEIDKLAYKEIDYGDIATIGVQQDLLLIIDCGEAFCDSDEEEYGREKFDFSNVLFIFGGAFQKLAGKESIENQDLVRFGLIPEFVNRMGNIIRMEPLSGDVIKKLTRHAVDEYNSYVPINKDEANVYTEMIHSAIMADKSHEQMGGRCVAPLVRKFFEDMMFSMEEVKTNGK